MAASVLADIDYGRYERRLARVLGRDPPFAVFDDGGNVLWRSAAAKGPLPGSALADVALRGDPSPCRLDLSGEGTLLCHPLRIDGKRVVGWAGIVSPAAQDTEVDALGDIAAAISGEVAYKSDLNGLTEDLAECYEELSLIYDINQQMEECRGDERAIFQDLLDTATARMNVELAVFLRPAERLCLHATGAGRTMPEVDLLLVELAGHLFRFVRSSGDTLVLNEPDDPRRTYILTYMPYRVLACPVRSERRIDALIVFLNRMEERPFSNNDRRLAEVLASHASSVAKSSLLVRNMRRFTEQLAAALVEAVEAKDPYTRGHSERVNAVSMQLGRAMGLGDEELEDLHWASLLHDVGKIGIPDAILCKPGALTEDEYTLVRVHPERSYEILRPIEHLKNAIPGIRHHHESYDGKGFPAGLRGERIPMLARLIAVADTYDSITSSRAYRAGRSHETALAEIRRVAGTQLDPVIVEIFAELCAGEPEWLSRLNVKRDAGVCAP